MNPIQLIADSGLQFYKFDLEIDSNADVIRGIGFYEWLDAKQAKITLEYATYLSEAEMWVSKRDLSRQGFINPEDDSITENVNFNALRELDEENEQFTVNNIDVVLEKLVGKWIPLPYFEGRGPKQTMFGPINWCRLKLIPTGIGQRRLQHYKAVLIFDTTTANDGSDDESPLIFEDCKYFRLCSDLDQILNYTQHQHNCGWVADYLADIIHGGADKIPNEFPSLRYIGFYAYFIKYLAELDGLFPEVELYPNARKNQVDVDFVLDIGNSNTCGILFETPVGKNSFEFTAVKKLKIQDLSHPEHDYTDPFSMRLAFHECDFGEMDHDPDFPKFQWPSFTRIGQEAKRLIYKSTNRITADGKDKITNHSSPKRYLWDDIETDVGWEPIKLGEETDNKLLYIKGVSEQFTKNGTFIPSPDFGTTSNFSRRSLMTFVFIEILAHAMMQINSISFRQSHGNATASRRLRRLIITCPTAMMQAEQVVLRQCAEEASIVLSRYYSRSYNTDYDKKNDPNKLEIIPSVKDLRKKLSVADTKKDWIYDEATCGQLVFLYAEIAKRYLNNCEKYFGLYGRVRKDLPGYDKPALTIGSVDIGGGTTDLMICTYKYSDSSGAAVLTPVPLYWESFNYAGDDLLKEIVRQVIIEGRVENESYRGCIGVIENYARERNIKNIERKLNMFFGIDSNNIDFVGRQMRRQFNTQISVPIAELYLNHAKNNESDKICTFEELFYKYRPNKELLHYFEQHFGFQFEDIRWKLSTQRIYDIVETAFEPMIKQLSTLIHVKACDFVLLAGRPTALEKISDLFLKFYPVSPDRIISLNDYRVGRWYPFQEGNGYFEDQKSLVAVGAGVALMGGKLDKLHGFRINTTYLKRDLISTAEYFGVFDRNTNSVRQVFISPVDNKQKLVLDSLPLTLGFKRLPANTYPGRVAYSLDFNTDAIAERQTMRHGNLEPSSLRQKIEDYKTNLKNRMPFTLQISREYRESRELIKIEYAEDCERNQLPNSIFQLKLKTLDEDQGYWLDTGAFTLKIDAK